ncbi:MAG: DUF4397 domain-containing protein [Alphaproteobacteria bacterium]|nr:DUF4397 domain-containing protein [Alphaproteobacteria bacterium]
MRTTTQLLALGILLTPGCDFVDFGDDDPIEDTAQDTAEDTADSGDDLPEPEGSAYVRYVNVVDGQELSLSGAFDANAAFIVDLGSKFFTQGTAYQDVGAGDWTFTLRGSGEQVLSLQLEDGAHYTLAAVRDPADQGAMAQLLVLEDELSSDAPVAQDHTRIHWVHAMALDGTYAGQVYMNWGSVDEEWYSAGPTSGTMFLDPHEGISWEYPFVTSPTYIFGQWGVPTELPQIALEVDAFIQVGEEELVNVFLTCTGACRPEDSFVLGQFEDGSTVTTQGCQVYATVNGQLDISDCP